VTPTLESPHRSGDPPKLEGEVPAELKRLWLPSKIQRLQLCFERHQLDRSF
jgi:hypothetical protein